MPGSGKSTIGRRLARHLDLPFADADAEVERRAGMPIAAIFEASGETAFRDLESAVLADLLVAGAPAVIATGGGAVVRDANRRLLRERATVVFLDAMPTELRQRVRADGSRPLLAGDDMLERLVRLHAERAPLYREVATVTLPPGRRRPDVAVRLICEALQRPTVDA
jgi:shikimate kinase